jgi:hypothetical protein
MADIETTAVSSAMPTKTAAQADAREMLSIAGFRQRIAEKRPNKYEPHDTEGANSRLDGRVAALAACLFSSD